MCHLPRRMAGEQEKPNPEGRQGTTICLRIISIRTGTMGDVFVWTGLESIRMNAEPHKYQAVKCYKIHKLCCEIHIAVISRSYSFLCCFIRTVCIGRVFFYIIRNRKAHTGCTIPHYFNYFRFNSASRLARTLTIANSAATKKPFNRTKIPAKSILILSNI